ncbi:MAG: protein kinase [Acidobacteriota bacterium]
MYEPGTVLDGKYEIDSSLGAGGMGDVYLVRHLHLDEKRVVKVLRQDVATDPDHNKRFQREARLATQVKHANVAILYDFAQLPEGSFYMVWEYVDGAEIGRELDTRGVFPIPLAIDLGIQALRGLETIHSVGVIHRDISPDNLMITRDVRGKERVKIIDLGLAKGLAPDPNFEITQVGTFMGKLRYCSPEQADSGKVALDPRSDLYSLALVLYEMICGMPAFEQGDRPAFVFQRLTQNPLSMVGRNPRVSVPRSLDQVLQTALRPDREDRFPNAIRFIEALERVGRSMNDLATREMPITLDARPPAEPIPRSTSELSSVERESLMRRIDAAAHRVRETTKVLDRLSMLIEAGELGEAREAIESLEATNPNARGLPDLRARLEEAEQSEARRRGRRELEQMLSNYIKNKQLPLAELAFDSLVEMDPEHPKREEFAGWMTLLRQELAQDDKVVKTLQSAREALAKGRRRTARRRLETLRKLDSDVAASFEQEMTEAAQREQEDEALEKRRSEFELHLEAGNLAEAEKALEALTALGATKVSLDFARGRLEDLRRQQAVADQVTSLEHRYRERLAVDDYRGAREIALEVENLLPGGDSRRGAMLAEVARLEADAGRRASVVQGERQVADLIAGGEAEKARLALGILLRLDPENRRRADFEARIAALEGER